MKFIANLRRQTLDAFSSHSVLADGYLLSAHRITNPALEMAGEVRGMGLPLFADNGSKKLIDEVIDQFGGRAKEISQVVKALRRELGRVPRGRDVSPKLRKEADSLAEAVAANCTERSRSINTRELLDRQLSMNPTDLIAQEDFATSCLMALNLDRETTGWPVDRISSRNRRSLRLWERVAGSADCKGLHVYAVLSAMDYNTARVAGTLAAEAGVEFAALGVASVTRDLNATDFYVLGNATFKLEKPVPRRYVRLAQVLKGIADGFRDRKAILSRFHCLGLGAPSLLPVAAAAFYPETLVTTDATSPIHDAARDRVLYDPQNFGDRATTVEIVERILSGGSWPFLSPFTSEFKDRFGHDPQRARGWWNAEKRPEITLSLLREPSELTAALPLFSEADESIRSKARDTHIAHNHWVLGELSKSRSGPDRRELALRIIGHWLMEPESVTTRGLKVARSILVSGDG